MQTFFGSVKNRKASSPRKLSGPAPLCFMPSNTIRFPTGSKLFLPVTRGGFAHEEFLRCRRSQGFKKQALQVRFLGSF
jgi:hypothetical protein